MTQQTIERMAIESGLANFIEPTNPAVLKFVAMVTAAKDVTPLPEFLGLPVVEDPAMLPGTFKIVQPTKGVA